MLIYTVANKEYQFFAPLYIYSALRSNPKSIVEIGLENPEQYKKDNSEMIGILQDRFGDKFTFSEVNFQNKLPGAVRFINEPTSIDSADYVYIGDIDILIFDENVKEMHLSNMNDNEAPFSNIIRPSEQTQEDYHRLSGLHFSPIDIQYPLPDLSDLDYSIDNNIYGADEHILYKIMKKNGYMISTDMNFRPVHGIHMRKSEHPFGRRSGIFGPKLSFEELTNNNQIKAWTGIEQKPYRKSFLDMIQEDHFKEMYFHLDVKARNLLIILENICHERFYEFETEAQTYISSKYVNKVLLSRKSSIFNKVIKSHKKMRRIYR